MGPLEVFRRWWRLRGAVWGCVGVGAVSCRARSTTMKVQAKPARGFPVIPAPLSSPLHVTFVGNGAHGCNLSAAIPGFVGPDGGGGSGWRWSVPGVFKYI